MSGTADAVRLSSPTPQRPLSGINNILHKSVTENMHMLIEANQANSGGFSV